MVENVPENLKFLVTNDGIRCTWDHLKGENEEVQYTLEMATQDSFLDAFKVLVSQTGNDHDYVLQPHVGVVVGLRYFIRLVVVFTKKGETYSVVANKSESYRFDDEMSKGKYCFPTVVSGV